MAQEGYDTLMALTDSRYRLSMIVARRASQLKVGVPTTLSVDEQPHTTNTVSIAMKELELGRGVRWGEDLPPLDEIRRLVDAGRRVEEPAFTISRPTVDDDDL